MENLINDDLELYSYDDEYVNETENQTESVAYIPKMNSMITSLN